MLKGHTNWVRSIAFSPDGQQIVSGSRDKSVRVWDVSTGDMLKVMKDHRSSVRSVAFSSDGKQIVSGSYDKVWVWDVSTGDKFKVLKGHADSVKSVAFSPDGKQIVFGSEDKSVRVWDVATSDELKVLKGHTDSIASVAFSPDGKQIVSGSDDKTVRVWDASTGNKLKVSGSKDKSVQVWDFGSLYIRETILDSHHDQKHTGWLLLMANVSCLCPPSCSFLMFPTFLLSRALLVPMLTSHIQSLAPNGSSVTIRSVHFVYYFLHAFIISV